MIWVGKNLAEYGVIGCIYKARDVGKVRSAIALAYAAANEGWMTAAVVEPVGRNAY